MLRTLAVLCLVVAPAIGIWEKGFKVRFGLNPLQFGSDYFISLPIDTTEANSSSWEIVTPPTLHSGYEGAQLWCPKDERTLGVLYDNTGYVMGVQIAIDPNNCNNVIFNWTQSGFIPWNNTVNGTTTFYWTTHQYYVSADFLKTNASVRVANRDSNYLLQDNEYYVSCLNQLVAIPTNTTKMSDTSFTEQACIVGMGTHYYYNMTKSLTCSEDTICTYFPLEYANQAIGVGFMWPANCTVPTGKKNYFENPTKSEIEMIVPNGPECLYDYGDSPGVSTMHIYFCETPYLITCVAGLG